MNLLHRIVHLSAWIFLTFFLMDSFAQNYQLSDSNAAVPYFQLRQIRIADQKLVEDYNRFLREYPNAAGRKQALENVYQLYKKEGTAEIFDIFLSKYPTAPQRPDSLNHLLKLFTKNIPPFGYRYYTRHLLFPSEKERLLQFSDFLEKSYGLRIRRSLYQKSPKSIQKGDSDPYSITTYILNGAPISQQQWQADIDRSILDRYVGTYEIQNQSSYAYVLGLRIIVKSVVPDKELTKEEKAELERRKKEALQKEKERALAEVSQREKEKREAMEREARLKEQRLLQDIKMVLQQIQSTLQKQLDNSTDNVTNLQMAASENATELKTQEVPTLESVSKALEAVSSSNETISQPDPQPEPKIEKSPFIIQEKLHHIVILPKSRWKNSIILKEFRPKEFHIYVSDVMIVNQDWITKLQLSLSRSIDNYIIAKNVLPNLETYLQDGKAYSWHPQLIQRKVEALYVLDREMYRNWSPYISMRVSTLADYDPDFENPVTVYITNKDVQPFRVFGDIGGKNPFEVDVAPKSTQRSEIKVRGIPKPELIPILKNIEPIYTKAAN